MRSLKDFAARARGKPVEEPPPIPPERVQELIALDMMMRETCGTELEIARRAIAAAKAKLR